MRIITDERCTTYQAPGHPERPERIAGTLAKLRAETELALTWAEPLPVEDQVLLRAHTAAHLQRLGVPEDFDGDTPAHRDIAEHARRSVGGALQALQSARAGEPAFSLMRPPGHHATPDRAMGFCYLNSIAVAVLEALATSAGRVAVCDFDVHHGNGTETILLNLPQTAFYSVHQHPCYPGTGTGHIGDNCFNYPILPGTPREAYRRVLEKALADLARFHPDLIAVSAGFDAYAQDPLAHGTLEAEDYHWLGQSIHSLGIPAFGILEGGYSDELPDLVLAFLKGLAGK